MGWLSKKESEDEVKLPELPKLPDLPKLPSLEKENQKLHPLPTFPSNEFGKTFTQNAIKEAVSGKKEVKDEEGDFDYKRIALENPKKNLTEEIGEKRFPVHTSISASSANSFQRKAESFVENKVKEKEPVFVRLDRFEESLLSFKKAKEDLDEINSLLKEMRKLKDKEEKELSDWQEKVLEIKSQLEKIDKDVFSKV